MLVFRERMLLAGEALISETVKHGEGEKEDTQSEQPVPTAGMLSAGRDMHISNLMFFGRTCLTIGDLCCLSLCDRFTSDRV